MLTSGQPTLGYPTLGQMILASQSQDVLGIGDRDAIIDYLQRAIEIAQWKANFDPYLGTMDICCDECGCVTLPSEVGVILACNVGGFPAMFRNSWFEYHINGPGSRSGAMGYGGLLGPSCGYVWDEKGLFPTFQDIQHWSYVAAFVEDQIDGNGTLRLQVFGETMDNAYNQKNLLTIPVAGPSTPGIFVPLLWQHAATDPLATQMRRITRVIKPITRGYVKLIAFPGQQQAEGRTIGYYAPNETDPQYRRIQVSAQCKWVRIKYRRSEIKFVNDTDIIPLPSKQALICLLKAIRFYDTNQLANAKAYEDKAVEILLERELIEAGPANFRPQIDPGVGLGGVDYR
jgi:hypothetical protein